MKRRQKMEGGGRGEYIYTKKTKIKSWINSFSFFLGFSLNLELKRKNDAMNKNKSKNKTKTESDKWSKKGNAN